MLRDGSGATDVNASDTDDDGVEDGERDEDEGDLLGTIASFDATTGTLVSASLGGHTISGVVTEDTELELDDETGALEEVEIHRTLP